LHPLGGPKRAATAAIVAAQMGGENDASARFCP
jgi:hypothetical protein